MGSTATCSPDRQLHAERRRAKLERDRARREAREAKRAQFVTGELAEIGRLVRIGWTTVPGRPRRLHSSSHIAGAGHRRVDGGAGGERAQPQRRCERGAAAASDR